MKVREQVIDNITKNTDLSLLSQLEATDFNSKDAEAKQNLLVSTQIYIGLNDTALEKFLVFAYRSNGELVAVDKNEATTDFSSDQRIVWLKVPKESANQAKVDGNLNYFHLIRALFFPKDPPPQETYKPEMDYKVIFESLQFFTKNNLPEWYRNAITYFVITNQKDALNDLFEAIVYSKDQFALGNEQVNKELTNDFEYQYSQPARIEKLKKYVQDAQDAITLKPFVEKLNNIKKEYNTILSTSKNPTFFMRNIGISDEDLKKIEELKMQFLKTISDMSEEQRKNPAIQELVKRTSPPAIPNIIDFHRSRYHILALGNTATRNKINSLMQTSEEKLLKTISRLLH